jgi:hypothetical protein
MKPKRNIWEMQHQTICKVIGMALDLRDLRRMAKTLNIQRDDPLMDLEFALHSTLTHICGSDNKVSRKTQKLIEQRFRRYSNKLVGLDPLEIIAGVKKGPEQLNVPLWAAVWGLASRGWEEGSAGETALFGHIHMLEHRLLKEYWRPNSEEKKSSEQELMEPEDLISRNRALLDLKRENKILEAKNQALEARLASFTDTEVSQPTVKLRAVPDASASEHRDKAARLQTALAAARAENKEIRAECAKLGRDLELMSMDALSAVSDSEICSNAAEECSCPLRSVLNGKRVAMVGGIDSLECHYRKLVESLGAGFFRHNGDGRAGIRTVEDCIGKADLVVCPVDVNSHNAAKSVKRLCKNRGIQCCFPATAGISGLKRALEDFCAAGHAA